MSVALRVGQCPSCGANLTFKVGSSRLAVCAFCQTAVARRGQDFSAIGKVADVIPTGSTLELGQHGKYDGHAFTLIGRAQLEWQGGVWDEWYASFDDGRWGWISEAQGRYYVLFKIASRAVPAREDVEAGQKVFFEGLGRFAITDVKEATLATCAGELPDEVVPGTTTRSADLEGAQSGFGTIDYGAPGDAVSLFIGKQVPLEELHLGPRTAAPERGARPTGEGLLCPQCKGAVEIRLPEQTQRVVCAYCGALLDTHQGPLQLIEALKRYATQPRIPIGTKGTLAGREVMVVGWMKRSCVVEGTRYHWQEFLLYQEKDTSFSWLVEQDGHWSLVDSISAAEVEEAHDVSYRGRRFRRFSEVQGSVDAVLGEFYWAVNQGDTAKLVDYIAPPNGISYEKSNGEVNWSYATYLELAEVQKAFTREATADVIRKGVGAIQPWPLEKAYQSASHWATFGMVAATLVFLGLAIAGDSGALLTEQFGPSELQVEMLDGSNEPPPTDAKTHTYLSRPFTIAEREPLRVEFSSVVLNSWASVGGAVINEATGDSAPFSLDTDYYAGVDDGESWSEGSREASTDLSALPAGTYVLRADLLWDPKATTPPAMKLALLHGGVSVWQWVATIFLLALPFGLLFQRSSFEKSRWWNSTETDSTSGGDE